MAEKFEVYTHNISKFVRYGIKCRKVFYLEEVLLSWTIILKCVCCEQDVWLQKE